MAVIIEGELLTPKRKRFVTEYLKDGNATKAAIRAGYSKNSAASIGHELIHNPLVRGQVSRETEKQGIQANVVTVQILEGLKEIAFAQEGVSKREKLKALEMLGRHIRFFDKQDEFSTTSGYEGPEGETDAKTRAVVELLTRGDRECLMEALAEKMDQSSDAGKVCTGTDPLGIMRDTLGLDQVRKSVNETVESLFRK